MTKERADAARNREKVLAAAAGLFAAKDPRTVTIEEIARAAGVGRGTLYRRYPDVASTTTALLDEHEKALQHELLQGPPPLGPAAPPGERLAAFYAAMAELLDRHVRLAPVSAPRPAPGGTPPAPTASGALTSWPCCARPTWPTRTRWPTPCWPRWRRRLRLPARARRDDRAPDRRAHRTRRRPGPLIPGPPAGGRGPLSGAKERWAKGARARENRRR